MNNHRMEHVAPGQLTVDTNVRTAAQIGTAFIASVKENGVLVPVVAHDKDGALHVLMGQRRTLAAVEAGLETMPVYVVDSPEEADRLATQVVENDQREALTDSDRAEAYHQMSLLGMTPTKIAKRTGANKGTVAQALTAKANPAASESLSQGLTIEQAAKLAEFDGHEEIVEKLTRVALEQPGRFAHEAQRATDDLSRQVAHAAAVAELVEAGKTVIEEKECNYDGMAKETRELNRADGEPANEDDATAYIVRVYYSGEVGKMPVVQDWKAAGFKDRWSSSSGARSGPMTDEEKTERRTVIENNKALESANVVRREWLTALLKRKTAPKGYLLFVASTLTGDLYEVGKASLEQATEFAGTKTGIREHVAKSATRNEFSILAVCFAAHERTIDRTAWRHSSKSHGEYLAQLVSWGYSPSDVETLMLPEVEEA